MCPRTMEQRSAFLDFISLSMQVFVTAFLSNGAKKTLILNKDKQQVTRGICHESVKFFGLGSKFSRITAKDYALCVIRRIKGGVVVGFN